jgi:hypothetical protein
MQEEIMAGLEKKSRAELEQLSPTQVGQLRLLIQKTWLGMMNA